MNIDEIRKIPIVEFLNQLGYQATGRGQQRIMVLFTMPQ